MPDPDKINTDGRKTNAARPLGEPDNKAGPERYPSTGQDDSVEAGEAVRTFDTGKLGPAGDPAEGKR